MGDTLLWQVGQVFGSFRAKGFDLMQGKLFDQEVTSNDYYTPKWIFEAMDLEFDLDVAAPAGGIPWIPAKMYYSQMWDGLSQDWVGRVWMNPPFSNPRPWVEKFKQHANGVALLPFAKSKWMNEFWPSVDAVTLLPSSLKFHDPKGSNGSIMYLCGLFAIGKDNVEAIAKIGHTLK
jgi:DNA N-6-adenine-methyltransferase (Dam)